MTTLMYVLGAILLIAALFLIVAVLMQNSKSHKLSGTIAGGAETFFGKTKGADVNKHLNTATTIVAIIFVVLVAVMYIIQPNVDTTAQGNSNVYVDESGNVIVGDDVDIIDEADVADDAAQDVAEDTAAESVEDTAEVAPVDTAEDTAEAEANEAVSE